MPHPSEPISAGANSLVAQGLNRVEARGFPGGVKSENDADGAGDADGGDDRGAPTRLRSDGRHDFR